MTGECNTIMERMEAVERRVSAIERRLPSAPSRRPGKGLTVAEVREAIAAKHAKIAAIVQSILKERRNG